jgi:hypothetical protein
MSPINCFRSTKDGIVQVFKLKDGEMVVPRPNKPIEPMRPVRPEAFVKGDDAETLVAEISTFDNEVEYCLSDFLTKLEQHEELGNHLHRSTIKFEVEKDYGLDGAYKITVITKEFRLKKNPDHDVQLAVYEEKLKQYEQDYKDYLIDCQTYEQKIKDFEINSKEAEIVQLNEQIETLKQKVQKLKNEKNT